MTERARLTSDRHLLLFSTTTDPASQGYTAHHDDKLSACQHVSVSLIQFKLAYRSLRRKTHKASPSGSATPTSNAPINNTGWKPALAPTEASPAWVRAASKKVRLTMR